MEKNTIIIIGGGFSGTLTAVNIIRASQSDKLQVLLIEREAEVGRGLAYRFGDDNLLLNVPAGNMSALADEPDHLIAYCQAIDPALNAKSFISRRMYGDYLEHSLAEAASGTPGALHTIIGEAVAVTRDATSHTLRVELACGSVFEAPQVVLALGHFPPKFPLAIIEEVQKHVVNPWDFNAMDRLDPDKPIAVIGMGHTAIDVVFRLTSCNSRRKVFLISRRGLLPLGHRINPILPTASGYPTYLVGLAPTVRAYTRAVRREVAYRQLTGGNWRDVINELRPHTPALWLSLLERERRRFLKTILPYWDIHRHRLSPIATSRLERLIKSGQVTRIAAKIVSIAPNSDDILVELKARLSCESQQVAVSAVINCTGPNQDLSTVSTPLMEQLLKAGMLQQDPLHLGLLLDDSYRVIDANNRTVPGLFYVGPMLKAKFWESIAVPELRGHTLKLAQALATETSRTSIP